ncbi:integrase catalytic domain-containing protein [Trichonephila clavipes]|nr:integrase catalytic domain-containing protein [Trichonephila clavipes]
MNRCPDLVVCLKRDLQCLRPEASLVLIYRPNVAGMKGRVDLAQPVKENPRPVVWKHYTLPLNPIRRKLILSLRNKKSGTGYLTHLQTRAKVECTEPNLMENQLLKDPNTKLLDWPMGRILEVFPGSDGLVRVVNVETSTGILKRAITKGIGEYFPPLHSHGKIVEVEVCGVAIYRPSGFRRSSSYCHLYGAPKPLGQYRRTSIARHDEFRSPRSDYVRRRSVVRKPEQQHDYCDLYIYL